jgi:hypothetical protein
LDSKERRFDVEKKAVHPFGSAFTEICIDLEEKKSCASEIANKEESV